MRYHKDWTLPENNEVFVFGSNMAGKHGLGAALKARTNYGAIYGVGEGMTGNSYAIPTKGHRLEILSLRVIHGYVQNFLTYARANLDTEFFVTRIGCGYAGYGDEHIGPMFMTAPPNCILPEEWREYR